MLIGFKQIYIKWNLMLKKNVYRIHFVLNVMYVTVSGFWNTKNGPKKSKYCIEMLSKEFPKEKVANFKLCLNFFLFSNPK